MDHSQFKNHHHYHAAARGVLPPDAYAYIANGADDEYTMHRNSEAFRHYQIRERRLIPATNTDTSITLFGTPHPTPLFLAPIALQAQFHPEGEIATAQGSSHSPYCMIASSFSSKAFPEIVSHATLTPWFQLYVTINRPTTERLIQQARDAGCEAIVLTIDAPVFGNREQHNKWMEEKVKAGIKFYGNFPDSRPELSPTLDWEFLTWLRKRSGNMKILLKGIMTKEDAHLCLEHNIDGLIVSNHGGRQLESGRSTIEALPEIVDAIQGKIPILIDSGFRRGTDIFKALALGADAVCIGRPYIYGLAAAGSEGVAHMMELLRQELIRCMQLSGTPTIASITPDYIQESPF